MLSGLRLNTLNRMRHTGRSKLQSPGQWVGGQNRNLQLGYHTFGYRRRMQTLLISNGLKKRKQNVRLLWTDTLHGVPQECERFIDGGWHATHWYWVTPRIGMTFLDNGSINGHLTFGWILQNSDVWETHNFECLSRNLHRIPTLPKTKHQMRRSRTSLKLIQAPCLVHHQFKRWCYFVRCQAKFII